ncbi:fumarylacetoacetate hydrolase [Phlyctema vagabunda]|uniref:Fumarylacetoacetate hydrolase n=1 Tax=Phlyctema vagabunda TaxID=108571 RepID=A0ABR4PVZ6_9HELO
MPFAKANNKNLFYTINRPVDSAKTVIIFIHGLGSSSCFYQTVIPNLDADICAIALDTCGSGLSKLACSEQTIETIREDVISLLDTLEIQERIIIVGHSMGGIIASSVAASHPERVKGVVLIGPVNPSTAMSEVFKKRIQVVQKDGLEALAATVPTAATGKASTSLHHAFIRTLILATSPEGYSSLCKVIATAKQLDYQAITVPLLVLAGENDNTAPLSGCQTILDLYGSSAEKKTIEVLPCVGHWHCVEEPGLVTEHIQKFVRGVST